MKRIFAQAAGRCLLPAFVLFAPLAPVLAQDANGDIYGKWVIKAEVGMGAVSSLDERQAHQIIGKPLLISPEKFEFNGRVCRYPKYERTREETAAHFDWAWRADIKKDVDIRLPNPVTIVETGCNILYPLRKDHLMIAEENVFFEAVRVQPSDIK